MSVMIVLLLFLQKQKNLGLGASDLRCKTYFTVRGTNINNKKKSTTL